MPSFIQSKEMLRVLVADDIDSSRQELVAMVRDIGHEVLEAPSGEVALHLIDSDCPDVILLDLLMPRMDGFQVAQEVRKRVNGKWLPVIVFSSLEGDEHFAKALQSGAADYLVKPVKPIILRAKLRQYQRILSMQSKMGLLAQRQHAINEHIADAVITTDEQGRVSELNRAARNIFQVNDAQVNMRLSVMDLIGKTLKQLMSRAEIEIILPDGRTVWFSVAHNSWAIGLQVFFTISLHDLSEVKRIERMKDEFLATVSHELRTPLTSILGALGLLAAGAGGPMPPAAVELAQVAKRNGDRLSRLIDDVLDLTKLEGNRMPLHLRTMDLRLLTEEAISANASYAQRTGVRIELQCVGHLFQVKLDPDRFLQVMANLLSNAIKHSPKDAVVRVVLETHGPSLKVHVMDQGPGIDKDFRKNLFEKFSQADSSDRRAMGGTGLGLYICRMLVEKMNGTVSADPGVTGGATFTVSFPRIVTPDERTWVLCIAQDRQLQERVLEWLSDVAKVELASSLETAAEIVLHLGAPSFVLADPQAQGPADQFCTKLLRIVANDRILLTGGALDAGFAARHGLQWLSLSITPRHEFVTQVRALLSGSPMDQQHGKI